MIGFYFKLWVFKVKLFGMFTKMLIFEFVFLFFELELLGREFRNLYF